MGVGVGGVLEGGGVRGAVGGGGGGGGVGGGRGARDPDARWQPWKLLFEIHPAAWKLLFQIPVHCLY